MASASLAYMSLPHVGPAPRESQTMFLQKLAPSTSKISISVNGAGSHTWSMRVPVDDWNEMLPTIESSIGSAFRNENVEVTVSFKDAKGTKAFQQGHVELAEAFGSVVPSAK